MRERLKEKEILKLKNNHLQKTLIIDSFIGEGASCLVYHAKYIDELGIIRNVRVKELFPLDGCECLRKENDVIWINEEKKNVYIPQFENAYKRQIYFQNMMNITNSSTQIIDNIYDANNTKYIILDCVNGKTFDQYQPNHINQIFEVILSLTKLVKKYHEQGYLMLDIKPENFLTIDETNQIIKYLDFDSITSLYAIKNKSITSLSCSLKYAAPELMRGEINKIDKCSDIYSIGAILYKKIFNLDITSKERSIGFNPNYDNVYFKNINPKIYKKLTSFFRKTLCNHSKRRYQDCDEVIFDLNELIEISKPNSLSLVPTSIIQKNYFVGREKECLEIEHAFNNGKKLVFIHGYGGIGKTELAKYYANSSRKNYHTVIFGKCNNTLKEFFENEDIFTIRNLRKDEISFEDKMRCIKELVDEETLIVVDNLDSLNDPYFEELCSFNCKLLVTTRAYLDDVITNTDTTQVITLNSLNLEDATCLFTHYYQRIISEEEQKYITEIIQHIEGFSLMIPILSKQMMLESILPSTMLKKLKNTKLKGISDSLIKHYKDNHIIQATAYNQALQLFNIFELSNEEKEILYIIALLGNVSISKQTLALFAGQIDLNLYDSKKINKNFISEISKLKENTNLKNINSLIEKGYLEYDCHYDVVRCHNIIREISLFEFDLSLNNTTLFKEIFSMIINKMREDYSQGRTIEFKSYHTNTSTSFDKVYESELKELCLNVFCNIDFSNYKNQEIISRNLLKHILVSGKNYTEIIQVYQKESIQPDIEYTLLCASWIQDLINNSSDLVEKQKMILDIKLNNPLKQLEILNLFFDEISIYPHLLFLNIEILTMLRTLLLSYERSRLNAIDLYDSFTVFDSIKQISFKSQDNLLNQIEGSIKNNFYENQLLEKIKHTDIRTISKPKKHEIIDFKNIDTCNTMIEYKRSLHEISDFCYKEIEGFNYQKTENDIEISICLSLIHQYKTSEDIERSQFITYFGNPSAFNQMNENIYEYLSRKNDYMFMALQLKQLKILKNIKEINAREYLLHSHRINTSVGKLLANLGEPSLLFEILRIYFKNIITKENLDNDKYQSYIDFFGNTRNTAVNEFYIECLSLAKKYHSSKLIQLVEQSKRETIGIDISYKDPEFSNNELLDSEVMWNRIEELFNKAIHIQENSDDLRKEIMLDINISNFYKQKLLNCIHPKITFFDALLIDEDSICDKYSYDIHYLEELLVREKEYSYEGIEEIIDLIEICFQYHLLGNKDKVDEYIFKINQYVDKNLIKEDKFNYLLFKLIYSFITVIHEQNFNTSKILVLNLYSHYMNFKHDYKFYIEDVYELKKMYDECDRKDDVIGPNLNELIRDYYEKLTKQACMNLSNKSLNDYERNKIDNEVLDAYNKIYEKMVSNGQDNIDFDELNDMLEKWDENLFL